MGGTVVEHHLEPKTVDVDGRPTSYSVGGTGFPVVFLHGWGLGPRPYTAGLLGVCRAGVRVIAPALPGFSGSDGPPLRHVSLDTFAGRIADLLDALELGKPVILVGHSFGGGVAIRLASRRPDLVRGMTLVNSVGGSPGPSRSRRVGDVRAPMRNRSWLRWWLSTLSELSARELLATLPVTAPELLPNLVLKPVTATLTGFVGMRAALADEAQDLVDSGMPVLFVWGDRDRLTTPGALSSVAGELPAEVVSGRHGWLLSSPALFSDLIVNSLVVHAMLERRRRGLATPPVVATPASLPDLLPIERRRQARHTPFPRPPLDGPSTRAGGDRP